MYTNKCLKCTKYMAKTTLKLILFMININNNNVINFFFKRWINTVFDLDFYYTKKENPYIR